MARISKALATKALKAVETQFKAYIEKGYEPELRVAESGRCWEIVWMYGPDEWAIRAFDTSTDPEVYQLAIDAGMTRDAALKTATIESTPCPAGVFAEAVNYSVLGLYRDDF